MHTSKPRVVPLALIPMMLLAGAVCLLVPTERAEAGSISGTWIWPSLATTNSSRWLRIELSYTATSEFIYSVSVGGLTAAPGLTLPPGFSIGTIVQAGTGGLGARVNPDTVRIDNPTTGVTILTLGPFCGSYNAFGERPADFPWVIGYIGSPGTATDQPSNVNTYFPTFSARFYDLSTGTPQTTTYYSTVTYQTVHDNDDLLEWWVSDGAGGIVDPLSVGPVEVLPDSGGGSSEYTFRVKYRSGLYSGLNLPPRWRTSEDFPNVTGYPGFIDRGRGFRYDRGDPNAVNQFNWLYGRTTDPFLDQVGYNRAEYDARGATEPQVLLIIDGQHWAPRYMMPEDPANTNYTNGVVFRYTIRPTDYQRFFDNIFLMPFDLPGADSWDLYATRLVGLPTSNNYAPFTAGKHKYEFWATNDFAPVGNRAWVQVGWPGNDAHTEYMERTAPEPRRVDGLRSSLQRTRISVWRDHSPNAGANSNVPYAAQQLRRFGDTSVDAPDPFGYTYKSHEASSDAHIAEDAGLTLDWLSDPDPVISLRRLPNVNPVLSAHPFFGQPGREGGISTPLPALLGGPGHAHQWAGGWMDNMLPNHTNWQAAGVDVGASPNPFEPEAGAGPNPPWKFTNDDTVLPNFANIHRETAETPFRGGKWTQSTLYTLRVNYWHSENIAPRYLRVYIRRNNPEGSPGLWFPYTMERFDPADTNFRDGVVYQYQVTPDQLPTDTAPSGGGPGDYNYYFVANDGTREASFPDRPNRFMYRDEYNVLRSIDDPGDIGVPSGEDGESYYWFRVNRRPMLANQSVTPAVGRIGDPFSFRVTYTDPDGEALNPDATGDRPFIAYLYVDVFGDLYGQATVEGDPTTLLPISDTQFHCAMPDGHLFADNELRGLYVVIESGAAVRRMYRVAGNTTDMTDPASPRNLVTLAPAPDPDLPGRLLADGVRDGDRLYFAQRTAMNKEDPSDNDYSDGVTYVFHTGGSMALGRGVHRYFFHFADDWGGWIYPNRSDVRVEGEYVRYPNAGEFSGPEVIDNTPPQLVDFRFRPATVDGTFDGNTGTHFIFYVTYVDQENNPPAFIRMGIDGTRNTPDFTLNLYPDDPGDTVYTDGAVFRSDPIRLTEGQHIFRAQTSDGQANYPPPPAYQPGPFAFMGPTARVTAHTATTLDYAFTRGVAFRNGRLAGIAVRVIEGLAQGNQYVIENNVGSTLTFPEGTDLAADGLMPNDRFIFDAAPGPNIARNTPCTLLFPDDDDIYEPENQVFPGLDPDVGDGSTEFTYRVIYRHVDQYGGIRGTPPEYVRVYIDNEPHDMTPVDPADTDYTDGAEFSFSISGLQQGVPHTYFFVASDGIDMARLPRLGELAFNRYDGPVVIEPPLPPANLFVTDTPDDHGDALDFRFDASLDDGGGADHVTEYHLYRNESGTPFADPPTLVIPAEKRPSYSGQDTHDATGLQKGVEYYYVVRAYAGPRLPVDANGVPLPAAVVNPAQQSADSNVEGPVAPRDNIPPGAPPSLVAVDPGLGGTIDLTWGLSPDDGAGAGDVVHYRLYRNRTGPPFTDPAIATIPAGETSYRDTTVTDGIEYYYAMRAFDGENLSPRVDADPSPIVPTDSEPPEIIPVQPVDGASDVPRATNIEFRVRDTGSGVARNTLRVWVNDQELDNADLDISGPDTQIRVVYDPPEEFPYLTSVRVAVEVEDGGGNFGQLDWRFTIEGPPTYEIVGTILDGAGAPVPGVEVTAGPFTATTDADGNYAITGLAAGSYSVTPRLRGRAFVPESAVRSVPPSQRADFTAETGYDITGRVVDGAGAGLEGVRVTDGIHEAFTDAAGGFIIRDLRAGNYTLVPQLSGYRFTPPSSLVELPRQQAPHMVQFTAAVEAFSISGNIRATDGTRVEGVRVVASGLDAREYSATTTAAGVYTIRDVPAGLYILTPSRTGWVFEPESTDVDLAGDRTGIDFIGLPVYEVPLPTGLSMVALPLTPRNLDPTAHVPEGVDVARWDPTLPDDVPDKYIRGRRLPLPKQYEMVPGFAFWMNNRTGAPVTLSTPGTPVDTGIPFTLSLKRGWNMAGNMFDAPLPWGRMNIAPGQAVRNYGFLYDRGTGGYQLVTNMEGIGTTSVVPRNAGFWIRSTAAASVMVTPVVSGAAEVADEAPAVSLAAGDFLIPLSVRAGRCADNTGVAGLISGAAAEMYAIEKPPVLSPHVDLYFAGEDGRRLAADIRTAASDARRWEFVVATDQVGERVELSLTDLSRVPTDMTVTLVDQATGKRLYARTMSGYAYTADETGSRRFTLEIAPRTEAGLVVSGATARPTGAAAVISYSVSAPAQVSATVMNIAGRPVRTLQSSGVSAAGLNSLTWNLRTDSGVRAPAGRYLVRITAVAEDGQSASVVTTLNVGR